MKILEGLKIQNFRNIKEANFDKFGDLNIFIGPNNCGKTNILEAINVLSKITYGESEGHYCAECERARSVYNEGKANIEEKIIGVACDFKENDLYNKIDDYEIKLKLNDNMFDIDRNFFDGLASDIGRNRQRTARHLLEMKNEEENFNTITLACKNKRIKSEHLSALYKNSILEKIKNSILFCPEARLTLYKKRPMKDYIAEKNFDIGFLMKMIGFIGEKIDSKITTFTQKTLDLIKDDNFIDTIDNQGSGVRSLICLACDIMSKEDETIILLDEPELGLNPSSKHAFLKFLLEESQNKQIFISTHDPTFVNPTLWRNFRLKNNQRPKVSIFLYSLIKEKFVNVDLNQSKEDPETFGGYLPHTISLKEKHIYVEGTSDVYIFQIFLEKYLKKFHKKNWFEKMNEIGLFHLGGSFWEHLLYTIPKNPYKSLIVLDGDKRKEAKSICKSYNEVSFANIPNFRFCKRLEEIRDCLRESNVFPIYCLKEKCIEEYLEPKPNYKISKYNKKKEAEIAERMNEVPEEIKKLFEIFLRSKDSNL